MRFAFCPTLIAFIILVFNYSLCEKLYFCFLPKSKQIVSHKNNLYFTAPILFSGILNIFEL
ncbi:hypothetical protein DBB36_22955 [Flavobacterium sp. WLB]|nr:hypothetical protein AKO67_15635 [Flavobacterium sp. VMW]OWU90861.1 hypothetical protein APR43_10300 [Flavobacterium sp. NLM]PUU67627.1 hypothetical protein DBB36_22955 [Flavobacterium sp. WLB]